jgi:hypothetical protein
MNACSRDELWEILVHINVAEIPQNNCKGFGNRSKPIETCSPQDCFQDRPCNRIQEAFSSEPCLGYVLFNIVLRHGRREAESQGERICSSQSII